MHCKISENIKIMIIDIKLNMLLEVIQYSI